MFRIRNGASGAIVETAKNQHPDRHMVGIQMIEKGRNQEEREGRRRRWKRLDIID